MPHVELQCHERAFDFFRGKVGINVDWVKLQVYGKDCVPEEFPEDVKSLAAILDRLPRRGGLPRRVAPGEKNM